MQMPDPAVEGQLKGKVALITGAASGIGRASAIVFAQAGAAVVALDRAAEVEETVSAIRKDNARATAIVGDSSQEATISGAIDAARPSRWTAACPARTPSCRPEYRDGTASTGEASG